MYMCFTGIICFCSPLNKEYCMRRLIMMLTALIVTVGTVAAEGPPPVLLTDGDNIVPVTVINALGRDVDKLTVSCDASALPSWLTVSSGTEPVAVENSGTRTIGLRLTVDGAPSNAVITAPLTITDGGGSSWPVTVTFTAEGRPETMDVLHGVSPNPFNPSTTISFSVATARHVTLTVYNTVGQRVCTVADGQFAAGSHTAVWRGTDGAGRRVSSGVYFCRMVAGDDFSRTVKMTLYE